MDKWSKLRVYLYETKLEQIDLKIAYAQSQIEPKVSFNAVYSLSQKREQVNDLCTHFNGHSDHGLFICVD